MMKCGVLFKQTTEVKREGGMSTHVRERER